MQGTQVRSLGQEDLLEEEMAPNTSNLPGKSDGQRSHVGCSPWGRRESDTTAAEHMHTACKLSIICSILSLFGVTFVESLQVPAESEDDFQSFPECPLIFYVLYPFPENSAKYSVQIGISLINILPPLK